MHIARSAGLVLIRFAYTFWVYVIFGTIFPHGELNETTLLALIIIAVMISLSSIDVILFRYFLNFRFSLWILRGGYISLWAWVLWGYFYSDRNEVGLWLTLTAFTISPISEIFVTALHFVANSFSFTMPPEMEAVKFLFWFFIRVLTSMVCFELIIRILVNAVKRRENQPTKSTGVVF